MSMKITEVTIRPTNDGLVRAYVDIVFDNCLMIEESRIVKGPTGLFVSFPANADTRMMIQRVILAEYDKLVAGSDPVPTIRSPSERLRALDQLKIDGLINEEEYSSKRKEILGEL